MRERGPEAGWVSEVVEQRVNRGARDHRTRVVRTEIVRHETEQMES